MKPLLLVLLLAGAATAVWYWLPGNRQRRFDKDVVLCLQRVSAPNLARCLTDYGWSEARAMPAQTDALIRMSRGF